MTVLDYHLSQSDIQTNAGARTIGMIATVAAIAFMGVAAVTATVSEPDPQGWHGNSSALRPEAR